MTGGPPPGHHSDPDGEHQYKGESGDEHIARGNALMRQANEELAHAKPPPLACVVCGAPIATPGDLFCSDTCRAQWRQAGEVRPDRRE
jgi:hypothetical protein